MLACLSVEAFAAKPSSNPSVSSKGDYIRIFEGSYSDSNEVTPGTGKTIYTDVWLKDRFYNKSDKILRTDSAPLGSMEKYVNGSWVVGKDNIDYPGDIEYDVKDPDIADVDQDGTVTGKNPGETDVIVKCDEITKEIPIKVEKKAEHTLTILYKYSDGTTAQEAKKLTLTEGQGYSVSSPLIPNYTADKPLVSGTMGTTNVDIVVTHTKTNSGTGGDTGDGDGTGDKPIYDPNERQSASVTVDIHIEAAKSANMNYNCLYDGKTITDETEFTITYNGTTWNAKYPTSGGKLIIDKLPYGDYVLTTTYKGKEYKFNITIDDTYKATEGTFKDLDLGKSSGGGTSEPTDPDNPDKPDNPDNPGGKPGDGGGGPWYRPDDDDDDGDTGNPSLPNRPTTTERTPGLPGNPVGPGGTENPPTEEPESPSIIDRIIDIFTEPETPNTDDNNNNENRETEIIGDENTPLTEGDNSNKPSGRKLHTCPWFYVAVVLTIINLVYIVIRALTKKDDDDDSEGKNQKDNK